MIEESPWYTNQDMTNLGNRQGIWQKLGGEGILKLGVVFVATLWILLLAASWADAADDSSGKDEYSFHWLDPEKKIYVLQNRRYLKSGRLQLSAQVGLGLSNPYRNSLAAEPRMSFFMSEAWGLEVFYGIVSNSANSRFTAFQQSTSNALWSAWREVKSQYGLLLHWAPWYAKINVFNKILYFDWYFTAGAGSLQTQADERRVVNVENIVTQTHTAIFIGTGHNYHLNRSWKVRLDLTGAIYHAPVLSTSSEKDWYSNFNFTAGVGYLL